jgi:hypothetical protein
MLTETQFDALMDAARRTNAERDQIDRQAGNSTPLETGPLGHITTIIAALRAGIRRQRWDCIAESLAMLEEIQALLLHAEQRRRAADTN